MIKTINKKILRGKCKKSMQQNLFTELLQIDFS